MISPDYDELEQVLTRINAVHKPAEVHGILCGLLVHESSIPADTFAGIILGQVEQDDVLKAEARESLKALHAKTLEQLYDPDLGLELVVMDDEEPLAQRVQSVCNWASGLIYGLAQQGVNTFSKFSEDTADFLNDCKEIANGNYELDDDEEDENLYQELIEYLRLGTLMIQEEMQPIKAPPQVH